MLGTGRRRGGGPNTKSDRSLSNRQLIDSATQAGYPETPLVVRDDVSPERVSSMTKAKPETLRHRVALRADNPTCQRTLGVERHVGRLGGSLGDRFGG